MEEKYGFVPELGQVVSNPYVKSFTNEEATDNPCWDGYEMVGMKMKDGKEVPNCVPKNESVVTEDKVYIDYLNKKKGFKQDRIKFSSYEAAVKWARTNFEKFDPDMIKYESVNEAYTKGNIFGGKIKIGGVSVPVEVELLGADNKKKVFITKVVHIDSKYHSKLPSTGILEIPIYLGIIGF